MCNKFEHTDGVCPYKSGFCRTQICDFLRGIKAWNTAPCLRRLFSTVIHLHMFDSWKVYKMGRPAPLLSLDAFPCLWRFSSTPCVFRPERHSWSVTTGSFRKIWNHMFQYFKCRFFHYQNWGSPLLWRSVPGVQHVFKQQHMLECRLIKYNRRQWRALQWGRKRPSLLLWAKTKVWLYFQGAPTALPLDLYESQAPLDELHAAVATEESICVRLVFGLMDWWNDAKVLTNQITKIRQHSWCQKVFSKFVFLSFNDIFFYIFSFL